MLLFAIVVYCYGRDDDRHYSTIVGDGDVDLDLLRCDVTIEFDRRFDVDIDLHGRFVMQTKVDSKVEIKGEFVEFCFDVKMQCLS